MYRIYCYFSPRVLICILTLEDNSKPSNRRILQSINHSVFLQHFSYEQCNTKCLTKQKQHTRIPPPAKSWKHMHTQTHMGTKNIHTGTHNTKWTSWNWKCVKKLNRKRRTRHHRQTHHWSPIAMCLVFWQMRQISKRSAGTFFLSCISRPENDFVESHYPSGLFFPVISCCW